MLKWDFRTVIMQKVGESIYVYYLNVECFRTSSFVVGGNAQ